MYYWARELSSIRSAARDRGIIGAFLGPRRYVSERFGVSGFLRTCPGGVRNPHAFISTYRGLAICYHYPGPILPASHV